MRHHRLILTAFSILWAVLPALAQPGTALANAGLEEDADRDGLPDGWRQYVRAFGQAQVTVDTAEKSRGAGAVRVALGDKSRCALSQEFRLAGTGAYTFSCALKTSVVAPVAVAMHWFRSDGLPVQLRFVRGESPSAMSLEPGEWARLAVVGIRPAEADVVQVAVIAGNGQTPAATVWADDARFGPGCKPWPLVANADFELDANNDGLPDGWGKGGAGTGFEVAVDRRAPHAGTAAVRLTGLPGHGDRICISQMTPVFTTPQRVRVSFWYKGSGKADGIVDVLPPEGVKNKEGGVYYDRWNFNAPTPQGEWRRFTLEHETTAEAREAGLMRLQFLMYQKGDGDLWYDDLELELLD